LDGEEKVYLLRNFLGKEMGNTFQRATGLYSNPCFSYTAEEGKGGKEKNAVSQ